ncbi:MAG: hypothetical protein QOJ91_2360 [Sphingomonadales bacterium]|jgi:hypothetical protein|nr:hypothetical protein [Sphingomonadales bacterium]
MSRVLTLLMILMLVLTHGTSLSAAICRHQNGFEHAAALQSRDTGISAAAHGEETARKAAANKAAPLDSGSVSLASDMLPPAGLPVPFRASERIERNLADAAMPVGASVLPLLEPPSA